MCSGSTAATMRFAATLALNVALLRVSVAVEVRSIEDAFFWARHAFESLPRTASLYESMSTAFSGIGAPETARSFFADAMRHVWGQTPERERLPCLYAIEVDERAR